MIGWRGWYVVECDGVAVVFVVDVVVGVGDLDDDEGDGEAVWCCSC